MRTLFDLIREPIIIGAFVLALLIVIVTYVGSDYDYGNVDTVDIPEPLTVAPNQPRSETRLELNLDGLSERVEAPQTELESEMGTLSGVSIVHGPIINELLNRCIF